MRKTSLFLIFLITSAILNAGNVNNELALKSKFGFSMLSCKFRKAIEMTLNKDHHILDGSIYCAYISDILFGSKGRCIDLNSKIDLLISIIFFQKSHIETTFFYSLKRSTIVKNQSGIYLFYSPLKGYPDSLKKITLESHFLSKLDYIHKSFILKIKELINNSKDSSELENKYNKLLTDFICSDYFLKKYKKFLCKI